MVERRRAVIADAVLHELALRVGVLRRALEHQVLEQVRHAALAVPFVARADQVGHVDRDRLLRPVGQQQDLQAVRKVVLADPAERGPASDPRRQRRLSRLCGGTGGEEHYGDQRRAEADRLKPARLKPAHRLEPRFGGGRPRIVPANRGPVPGEAYCIRANLHHPVPEGGP